TLAGGFAAGLKPTGNKDPFALRRAALGLARTLIEGGIELDLPAALAAAIAALPPGDAGIAAFQQSLAGGVPGSPAGELYDFILERLRGYYADRGVPARHFSAVAALRPVSLRDFDRRLAAIADFAQRPEAEALAAADKRIRNILRKADDAVADTVDAGLLLEPAEQALATAVETAWAEAGPALEAGDYV